MRSLKVLLWVLFASNVILIDWLGNSFLKSPTEPKGIYQVPFDMHGTTVYLSPLQNDAYFGAFVAGFMLVIAAAFAQGLSGYRAEKRQVRDDAGR